MEFDGYANIIRDILAHEKTHPENKINMDEVIIEGDTVKPACSFCGCKVSHKDED